MSLKHAILGLLLEKAMTGYELKTQAFDQSVRHFWGADQAQIYRTLNQLVEADYVNYQLELQTDSPNRKRYSITEQGKQELIRWQVEGYTPAVLKEPFMIKFFFGHTLSNEQLIEMIQVQIEEQTKIKEELTAKFATLPKDDPHSANVFKSLTLERGIMHADAWINWCQSALANIRNRK